MKESPISKQLLNCTKNRIKLHKKRPEIICGWCSAPEPAETAYDALLDPIVGWGRREHPLPIPLPKMSLTVVVGLKLKGAVITGFRLSFMALQM